MFSSREYRQQSFLVYKMIPDNDIIISIVTSGINQYHLQIIQKKQYYKIQLRMKIQSPEPIINQESYFAKVKRLAALKKTSSRFLKWNQTAQSWQRVEPVRSATPSTKEQITSLTFNVLFDRFHHANRRGCMEHVLNSIQRFTYTLSEIEKIRPDIATLQEVTRAFLDQLLQCEWAKQEYWICDVEPEKKGFGNILMTKIEPICLESIKVSGLPRTIETGFFPFLDRQSKEVKIITFSSVHLIALDTNAPIRVRQLSDLVKKIEQFTPVLSGFILQGDMNFHAESESQTATKLGLKDCWIQVHKSIQKNPGYTFDSNENSLINQMYWGFEKRQMRLDRIFYSGQIFKPKSIQIVLNQQIFNEGKDKKTINRHSFLKGGFLYMSDYFGWDFRKNMRDFLFASDHFGLLAELKICGMGAPEDK